MKLLSSDIRGIKTGFLVFWMFVAQGCQEPFQPVDPDYKTWQGNSASTLEIKKKILECGGPNPEGTSGPDVPLNVFFLMALCLEESGFSAMRYAGKGQREVKQFWCANHPDLPACQPGAIIPTPSVERRLNSRYCQSRTSYQACYEDFLWVSEGYCQTLEYPYWNAPLDWLDEQDCEAAQIRRAADYCGRGDYSKLPAECLP